MISVRTNPRTLAPSLPLSLSPSLRYLSSVSALLGTSSRRRGDTRHPASCYGGQQSCDRRSDLQAIYRSSRPAIVGYGSQLRGCARASPCRLHSSGCARNGIGSREPERMAALRVAPCHLIFIIYIRTVSQSSRRACQLVSRPPSLVLSFPVI